MKAIVYHRYGSPNVLQCEEIDKPVPEDDQILIKVRDASVNPLDCGEVKGVPYICRILFGLRKPEATRPGRAGTDVAGQIEAVGRNVTQFKAGDEVLGYASVTRRLRVSKSGSMSRGLSLNTYVFPRRRWS